MKTRTPRSRVALLLINSAANFTRALSSSAVNVVLPVMLVVVLAPQVYPVWALAFSLSAFVLYLDLGVPTSVQALVGRASAIEARRTALTATGSGVTITAIAGLISLVMLALIGVGSGVLFPDLPPQYAHEFVVTLVVLAAGQVLGLVANVLGAYFSGNQRSHVPMFVLVPGRLLSAALAGFFAVATGDIRLAAVGYAAPMVIATALLGILTVREWLARKPLLGEASTISSVLRYSGPLIIWNIAMLVVTGIGVVLVGRFDFAAVAIYSLIMVTVAGISAVESSLTAPLLPELGRRWESSAMIPGELDSVLSRFLPLNATLLAVGSAGVILGGSIVLEAGWLDDGVATGEAPLLLTIVLLATALRLTMIPLSLAYIATKTHTRVILPPVAEAAVNLIASVGLGLWLGAVGVALGYLIGAVLSVVMMIWWAMRRSGVVELRPLDVVRLTIARPMLPLVPALVGLLVVEFAPLESVASIAVLIMLGLTALVLGWLCVRRDVGALRSSRL